MKPCAILSSNLERTLEWAVNTLGIISIDLNRRRLIGKDEETYIIIFTDEQSISWEFSRYIKAPDFRTLEDVVRERIR